EKFNKKQETKERRTLNSKTFKEGNGKYSTYVFTENIHFKNSKGELEEIDNTLIENKEKKGIVYKNKANDLKVSFPSKVEKNNPIKVEKDNTYIEMLPVEGDFSKSSALDNKILYSDVLEGIDYQYTVLNSRVKEDIILNHIVEKNEFYFEIKSSGLTLKEEGGAIFAYDKKYKEPVWRISAPKMIDANGKSSTNIKVTLDKKLFGNDRIKITADEDWLKAKDRAYPVKIDPTTVWVHDSALFDNCVEDNHPDTITDNPYSYIGYDDGKASGNLKERGTYLGKTRTYVRFNLPKLSEDSVVTYASLNMYRYTNFSSLVRSVELHRVNKNYNIANLTWKNQPLETSYETARDMAGGIGFLTWNIKNLVNEWYNGTPNYGVVLRYSDEKAQCEVFRSNEYTDESQRPYVKIEYEEQGSIVIDDLVKPTINLRPIVQTNNSGLIRFLGVSADGIAKPKSKVEYFTEPENSIGFNGIVLADKDYIYPNLNPVDGAQTYNTKESNWQTDKGFIPEFDKLYRIKAFSTIEVKDEAVEGEESDEPIPSRIDKS
ncbi:MAG: DNRLRE domain-containing protein, partial [Clostridium sp.]|nr:DNRLRE domain-containing protein [Clostridium sp.]